MRLYLSSENVGRHSDYLIKMVGKNKKVAYIPNARDFWDDKNASQEKTAKHCSQFEELGFEFVEFDLKNYFGDKKFSREIIDGFGLVWVPGGNTFLLRRAMFDSGFDVIISDLVKENKIVYGGSSAGAIVTTPSLKGTEIGDTPEEVKNIYGKEIIWDGLGYISKYLSVHVGNDWFDKESKLVNKYFEDNKLPYVQLRDGQVYIVDGDREEFLA